MMSADAIAGVARVAAPTNVAVKATVLVFAELRKLIVINHTGSPETDQCYTSEFTNNLIGQDVA